MKNVRSVLFALTVLLLATAAQAQQIKVKADVPFDFVVGDRAYPAGEYFLQSMFKGDSAIRIDNTREAAAGIVLTDACSSLKPAATTTLVFHRVSGHYFLYQVWTEGNTLGRQFQMTRAEVQLAQNHEKPERVIVAANIFR